LITQDKNKYKSPKYRLVVRFTNRYVICQIVFSEIDGDKVLCSANSKELIQHGLKVGLKNYAAAYATGLLVARRLLKKVGLDETYNGVEEPTGEVVSTEGEDGRTFFVPEVDEAKRPFRCLLDVGIKNTTTGARVFGAMKGASDGGLDIPHNHKRFPGYSRDTKQFEADVHKSHIFGGHVADYMKTMEEDDEENYKKHFRGYHDEDLSADDLEEHLEKVHASIRENPDAEEKDAFADFDREHAKPKKKTLEQRKADVAAKKQSFRGDEKEEDAMEEVEAEEEEEEKPSVVPTTKASSY